MYASAIHGPKIYVCRCATCPLVLGEVTGGCLGLKLGRKGFLDLCVMCLVLLLILRYFILTQCYCIFYRCQRRVQALALCCQALCQPWSFHDVQSSMDLLDVSDWFNRNSSATVFRSCLCLMNVLLGAIAIFVCSTYIVIVHFSALTNKRCLDDRPQCSVMYTHFIVFQSN